MLSVTFPVGLVCILAGLALEVVVAVREQAKARADSLAPLFQPQAAAFSMMPAMLPPKTATITRTATTMPTMPKPRATPVVG
jgi:hypothetical protein